MPIAHPIEWNDERVADLWGYYSQNKFFDNRYFMKNRGNHVVKYIAGKIELEGKRILDFGSGPGHLLECFSRLGKKVRYSALDIAPDSIRLLKQKYSLNPLFQDAFSIEDNLEIYRESFDLVFVCEVIEHLDDDKLNVMLDTIKLLLAPGGYVYITTPNREDLDELTMFCPECGCLFHQWQHVRSWSASTVHDFMRSNGFVTISSAETEFAGYYRKIRSFIKKLIRKNVILPHLAYIGRFDGQTISGSAIKGKK